MALCTQNGAFPEENGDAMSFDECMQLLAETFPLVETAEVRMCYQDRSFSSFIVKPDMIVRFTTRQSVYHSNH